MRAHVIVNRRAGRLDQAGALLAELRRPRPGVRVLETRSREELGEAVGYILATNPEAAVVLAGGDGTHMAGVSALAGALGDERLPPIALAPGGTVNTVARNWGLSGDPVRYTARLLDAISASAVRSVRRPTLRVREDDARERVGFIAGAGLVARFFEAYEERGAKGNALAAKIVARVFAGSVVGSPFARSILDPVPCAVTVDGAPAPFPHVSLLCASVVRDVGLGLRLLYRAGSSLDRFHVVATPLGPRALGPQMPLVLAGRPLVGPRVDALAEALRLSFPERGAYVLDGELLFARDVEVSAGPILDVLGA